MLYLGIVAKFNFTPIWDSVVLFPLNDHITDIVLIICELLLFAHYILYVPNFQFSPSLLVWIFKFMSK